ncbi:hypothetical protein NA57DRAFT_45755 [Rhizodiscina lignyota]|uniref:Glutathione S-transferase n=1 Tax=Rhizodiscina lignyota TaxID=1504668 RepID=A0A9P4I7S6_9PEZI|nr:hypothetical protein NA57DRAFT_45755 [Rhizodiscina lignyota]
MSKPSITLFFLQASRSIRTAWLLEALSLPYDVKFYNRLNGKAPPEFKQTCGNPLGKSPTMKDGDLTLWESGAIAEYILQMWTHAAEGTFLLHSLAIAYAVGNTPSSVSDEAKGEMVKGMSVAVQNDLDWLEKELGDEGTGWLAGKDLTAADVMVHFSAQFIFARDLGTKGVDKGSRWKNITGWLQRCEGSESYKRAVQKTGYTL